MGNSAWGRLPLGEIVLPENAANSDLESQGAVVDELIADTASRLLFYHMKKPKLQYDEYIVKRLKKIMQKNSHLQMSAEGNDLPSIRNHWLA